MLLGWVDSQTNPAAAILSRLTGLSIYIFLYKRRRRRMVLRTPIQKWVGERESMVAATIM